MNVPLVLGERLLPPCKGVKFKLVRNKPEVMEVVATAEAIQQPHMPLLCLYDTGWVYTTEDSSGSTGWPFPWVKSTSKKSNCSLS